MLTYTPPDPRRPQKTHEKPWLLLLMAFAWLWPGVFSHDLWNPAEPSLFTASESMKTVAACWLHKSSANPTSPSPLLFVGSNRIPNPVFALGGRCL